MVEVHHDEGVANHIGPEPCGRAREGTCEASVGEPVGQPLSRERAIVPGADVVTVTEGNTCTGVSASLCRPSVVKDPGMQARALRGNRETSRPTTGPRAVWSASGRRGAEADDARTGEVRPRHSSCEAPEQGRSAGCGGGGAKGGGRGEHGPGQHVPDTEPGKRVTRTGPCTAMRGP